MHFISVSEPGLPSSSEGFSLRFEIGVEVLVEGTGLRAADGQP